MPRYIDADKFIEWLDAGHFRSANEVCLSENNVIKMIKSQPTADVVEVVRCKDCGSYNKHYGECTLNGSYFGENGYCCQGKRTPKERGGEG